jgi:putative sporulation protein YyaC
MKLEPMSSHAPYCLNVDEAGLIVFLRSIRNKRGRISDFCFVCIGTDRSTGDSLGPWVGTELAETGYPYVIGTLSRPCDASNMMDRLREIPEGATVIAIDACLGRPASVGTFQVSNQPVKPGKSVGQMLPEVGDYSIAAVVNVENPKPYWTLQNTSLYFVLGMAKQISRAIRTAFPLEADAKPFRR